MSPAERAARHKAWLASFQFTERDWRRIRQLAADTNGNYAPPALVDLDVPYRVIAVMPAASCRHYNGKLLGVIEGRAILVWELVGREREAWARRK